MSLWHCEHQGIHGPESHCSTASRVQVGLPVEMPRPVELPPLTVTVRTPAAAPAVETMTPEDAKMLVKSIDTTTHAFYLTHVEALRILATYHAHAALQGELDAATIRGDALHVENARLEADKQRVYEKGYVDGCRFVEREVNRLAEQLRLANIDACNNESEANDLRARLASAEQVIAKAHEAIEGGESEYGYRILERAALRARCQQADVY